MNNRLVFVTILIVSVALIFLSAFVLSRYVEGDSFVMASSGYRGTVYNPPLELTDFTLPASTGTDLSLSDLRGKWVLMFFGYTHCPDFCPMTLIEYRQVIEILEHDATQLQVVFVSVDGERDTPDVLANYVARFNPTFIGLSGDDDTLAKIQPEFGLYYQRHENTARHDNYYMVDHSTHSYLIDPQGRLRIAYAYDTDSNILAESIRDMIRRN